MAPQCCDYREHRTTTNNYEFIRDARYPKRNFKLASIETVKTQSHAGGKPQRVMWARDPVHTHEDSEKRSFLRFRATTRRHGEDTLTTTRVRWRAIGPP